MINNTGVIVPEQIGKEDWIASIGAKSIDYKEINPTGDWGAYLPIGEKQHSVYFDSKGCVNWSFLNCIETQLNYMVSYGTLPQEHYTFLKENGYFKDCAINFSDRHLAKQSGTTKKGNWLTKVADTARHQGLLPESDWNYPISQRNPVFDWDDFYKEIPQHLKDKALKFLDYFEIQYEWVSLSYAQADHEEIKRHLKQAPLQLAAPVCPGWKSSDVVQRCGSKKAQHATEVYCLSNNIYDFDSYDPYGKILALDYYMPWLLKIVLLVKEKNMEVDETTLNKLYNELLMREPDESARGYIGHKETFVRTELLKSPERELIEGIIYSARKL